MKQIYFTVGPSEIFPTVAKNIKSAIKEDILSISHRGRKFEILYQSVDANLKKLLKIPIEYKIFFLSSGTEGMERSIENCVEENSFHFVNGSFSKRFYTIAKELGKNAQKYEVDFGQQFDFSKVKIPKSAELLCLVHNDTSTGTTIPMEEIYKLKKKNPKLLIALDTVSSAPYPELDFSLLDVVFFSIQKGMGLPAGLGVAIVSPAALIKAKKIMQKNKSIGSYHNFVNMQKSLDKWQTQETPNVLGIYLLEKVLKDFSKIGLKKIRKDIDEKASLLYSFFDTSKKFKPFISDTTTRSKTVLTITVPDDSEKAITVLKKHGIVVGSGYGDYKDSQIRIANFPSTSKKDVLKLIKTVKKYL